MLQGKIENGQFPHPTEADFGPIVQYAQEQAEMLPVSVESLMENKATAITVIEGIVVAMASIKSVEEIVDKRNHDSWQSHHYLLLGSCATLPDWQDKGLNTDLVLMLTDNGFYNDQPATQGVTGFFNSHSQSVAKKLGFTSSCYWLWGKEEINEAGRKRFTYDFPAGDTHD